MANRRFNTQVAQPRKALAAGGTVTKGVKEDSMRDRKKQPLKKVRPEQKGLKKLPTKVRNKMGYMKDGGKVKSKGSEHPLADREGNVKHRLKSQKQLKAITDTKKYKDAGYKDKQKMLDAGGAYTKSAPDKKSRVSRMGGGMSTARKDMMSGYYKNDMGMKGGRMYKHGGKVRKMSQGYKDRKDESIAMRIRKPRTARQLKDSRDESYGKFGSKAKKSGKINR